MNNSLLIKHIMGLKLKELRQSSNLSFQELADKTGLSISYLNEIEKGKKYPKGDKIMALANAFNIEYDELVSLKVSKKLQPIIDLLDSNLIKEFPLEIFGLEIHSLIELLSFAPEKVNAFINTVVQMARNYEMRKEDFYYAALRSFQELNDNYFIEIENFTKKFRLEYNSLAHINPSVDSLTQILNKMGIAVNYDLANFSELQKIRALKVESKNQLLLNSWLTSSQTKFQLAREIGYQYMKLNDRAYETPVQKAESFEKLLNNFKASYFASSLLMEEKEVIKDVRQFAKLKTWQPQEFLNFLSKYDCTVEMLMSRLSNILPKHFDLKNLFFLIFSTADECETLDLTKELHLSQFHHPHTNFLNEHYCRRWVAIKSLQQIANAQSREEKLIALAQRSEYWNTPNEYLCLSIAKSRNAKKMERISVTIGFLVDDELKKTVKFLDDLNLKRELVHTTCERCGIENCSERKAKPKVLNFLENQKIIDEKLKTIILS